MLHDMVQKNRNNTVTIVTIRPLHSKDPINRRCQTLWKNEQVSDEGAFRSGKAYVGL